LDLNIKYNLLNEDEKSLKFTVDGSAFSVVTKEEAQNQDIEFWLSKTPHERLEALESLRQIAYGYDPATIRPQRFFEVIKRQ
jgi:hypothetical protein